MTERGNSQKNSPALVRFAALLEQIITTFLAIFAASKHAAQQSRDPHCEQHREEDQRRDRDGD